MSFQRGNAVPPLDASLRRSVSSASSSASPQRPKPTSSSTKPSSAPQRHNAVPSLAVVGPATDESFSRSRDSLHHAILSARAAIKDSAEFSARSSSSSRASLAPSTATTCALSVKSLARAERCLGKSLPLDPSGTHAILTRVDIERIRDRETLEFLRSNSQILVRYMREAEPTADSFSVSPATPPRARVGVSMGEVAKLVDALTEQIGTFITGVDTDGHEYKIETAPNGVLLVPLEDPTALAPSDSADFGDCLLNELDNLEEIMSLPRGTPLPEREDSVVCGSDLIDDMEGGLTMEEREMLRDPPQTFAQYEQQQQQHQVNVSNLASGVETPPRDKVLEEFLRRARQSVGQAHFMKGTTVSDSRKIHRFVVPLQPLQESSSALVPSPPQQKAKSAFRLSFASRPAVFQQLSNASTSSQSLMSVQKASSSVPLRARYTLSEDEEKRVCFILDNDDWEERAMGLDKANASTDVEGSGVVVTASPLGPRLLSYDAVSASSYAPRHGFGMDQATLSKLAAIDEEIRHFRVRRQITSYEGEDGTSTAVTAAASDLDAAANGRSNSSAVSVQKDGNQQMQAAREKANAMLMEFRMARKQREKLAVINEQIGRLSEELEALSAPPFSLTDFSLESAVVEWPPSVSPPSEDTVQRLLAEARAEATQ